MRLPLWEPCSLQETTPFNQDPAARLLMVCPCQETGGLPETGLSLNEASWLADRSP